jgi:hypothetical protein
MNQMLILNPANPNQILSTILMGPKQPASASDIANTNMASSSPSKTVYLDVSYLSTQAGAFWQMSFYKNFWNNNPTKTGVPDLACSVGFQVENALTPLLNSIEVTPNTVILMMESQTGRLLATNKANSISVNQTVSGSNTTTPVRVTADASPDARISQVGLGLLNAYGGSYANLPFTGSDGSSVSIASIQLPSTATYDSEKWLVGTTKFQLQSNGQSSAEFLLIVAFPRSDIFGDIDKANTVTLITSICVSVGGLLIACSATFMALRPLHKMAISMKQLTKFDFSSLEKGELKSRSMVTEIREVEGVFNTMVVAFASAIKKNRALMSGSAGTSSSAHGRA